MTPTTSSQHGTDRVTSSIVSKSSFFSGMRILPKTQREAMYHVYAFCRSVDDIADSNLPQKKRLEDLNLWRHQIQELYRTALEGNLTRGLLTIVQNFQLKEQDFMSVIEGMEMDVINLNSFFDWKTLDKYCDCVASAVGRLSSQIFGIDENSGNALSHHLGRALQLTNILRDIDEDAEIGRFYFPLEELEKNNIRHINIEDIISHEFFGRVCETIAARSFFHFGEAERIMNSLPRKSVKSPRIMSSVYKVLLKKLLKRGWKRPRQRISTPKRHIFLSIIKYGII